MHILNITEEGRGGGALKRIFLLSRATKDRVRFTIICPKGAKGFISELLKEKIAFQAIPLHHLNKKPAQLLRYILLFVPEVVRLSLIIYKLKPDLVYINGSWQFKGLLASFLVGKSSIWHMNDSFQPFVVRKIFSLLSPLPSALIFASKNTKKYYCSLSPLILKKPNFIIPAPVDMDLFYNYSSDTFKEISGIKLLSTGYINPNKDFECLIKAFSLVQKDYNEPVHLFIAGPVLHSQRKHYAFLISLIKKYKINNVHFLGFRKDIGDLLNSVDIYVCSSKNEASPISVWEALACEKAVISTSVGDIPEIFRNYKCGVCVPTEDPVALSNAIRKLLNDPEGAKRFRKNARKAAHELFSVEMVARKHLEFYNQILKNG